MRDTYPEACLPHGSLTIKPPPPTLTHPEKHIRVSRVIMAGMEEVKVDGWDLRLAFDDDFS